MPNSFQIICKAVSWRIIGILYTCTVSFILTGHMIFSIGLGALEFIIKIVLFFFHEKLWMQKKKIVCLVFIGGRVGSSLVMGMLKKSGMNIGKVGTATDVKNPNGYFEIEEMITDVYTNIYPQLSGPMPYPVKKTDPEIHKFLTREIVDDFEKKFFKWFKGSNRQLALKVGYLHPIELFKKIARNHGYKLIPVYLCRAPKATTQSIQAMHSGPRTTGQWLNWHDQWQQVASDFEFDNEIYFEDWFTEPYKTYLKLYNMVKPPIKLTEAQVIEYINPTYKHF